MKKASIAIVAAELNRPLIDAMVVAARDEASSRGVEIAEVVRVPGCYELPLIVEAVLTNLGVAAVVALGYIERGETLHGEVMGHVVHGALTRISLQHAKPIGLGIIGPGATPEQADARKDDYARAAVRAVIASLEALHRLAVRDPGENAG